MNDIAAEIRSTLSQSSDMEERVREDFAVLFVSFDLVNSTAFKAAHDRWPLVISQFYEITLREVRELSPDFKLWKFVGDEVLFFRPVSDFSQLAADIKGLFSAIGKVIQHMDATFEETKNFLSVKGTAWLARVTYVPPGQMRGVFQQEVGGKSLTNIMVEVPHEEAGSVVDFLGPDVDVGFRIAKFSDKKKLVLSANLAKCLISYCAGDAIEASHLKIVGIEALRGVWNGRPYPIIWYFEDWNAISSTFYYDELDGATEGSALIKRVAEGKYREIAFLRKIYADLGKNKEVEDIEQVVKSGELNLFRKPQEDTINRSKVAEVHCAAICFRADGKVLIARRHDTKKRLNGIWEFGCGQLHTGQDFHECIRESYKEDFGAEIGFISDLPVSSYVIPSQPKVPGLLFYAEITNPDELERLFARSKHSEIKWHDPETKAAKNEFVPDFQKSLNKALDHRKKNRQKT